MPLPDTPIIRETFSDLEAGVLNNENWFHTFLSIATHTDLDLVDLARRTRTVASTFPSNSHEHHYLIEHAEVLEQISDIGVEAAALAKLGTSGLLAGQARLTREEYYASGNPEKLQEALNLFFAALSAGDDPAVYDRGMTMQGTAATLVDMADVVNSPHLWALAGMAFLASLAVRFSAFPLTPTYEWIAPIRSATIGAQMCWERLSDSAVPESLSRFAREVLPRLTGLLSEIGDEEPHVLPWSPGLTGAIRGLVVLTKVLANDYPPVVQLATTPEERAFGDAVERTLRTYFEYYGTDYFRMYLYPPTLEAMGLETIPDQSEDREAATAERRERALSQLDSELSELEDELKKADSADAADFEALLRLRMAALYMDELPDEGQRLWQRARDLIDQQLVNLGGSEDHRPAGHLSLPNPLEDLNRLCRLIDAVMEYRRGDTAIALDHLRELLISDDMMLLIETVCGIFQTILSDDANPRPELLVLPTAILVIALTGTSTCRKLCEQYGLSEVAEQLEPRHQMIVNTGIPFILDEYFVNIVGVAPLVELDPSITDLGPAVFWLLNLASVDRDTFTVDRQEVRHPVAQAYCSGLLKLSDDKIARTFQINLGVEFLQWHEFPEAIRWLAHARDSAIKAQDLEDLALADLDLSVAYARLLENVNPNWTLSNLELADQWITWGYSGLAYVAEAMGVLAYLESSFTPADRYAVYDAGFSEVQIAAASLLCRLRDSSLLTEYGLNIREAWFFSELRSHLLEGVRLAPFRPLLSWRDRCWLAGVGVAMDEIMSGIGNDAESRMIEASSIVSIGDGTRGWLTTLKDPWSDEWASSFFVEPFIFGSSFTDPGSLESSTSRDQTYSRLGAILPQRFWEVATALAKSTQRGRLYVSIDPLTPPIALGLWADPLSGLAVWQAFDVLYCNDIACGLDNLEVAEAISNPATLDCFVVCDPLGDLDMARSVPLRSSKVIGNFGNDGGSPATRAELLELLIACGKEDGIFVYQGHSAAGIRSRPGSAALVLETTIDCREIADLFTVEEIIRCIATSDHETRVPRRMVLLSCASGQSGSGYDATSLASAFIGWGARYVICSLISIPDDGSWTEVTEAACEVLRAPDPARMFSSWQSIEIARASDESWRAILESLVLFSAFTADAGGAR